MQGEKAALDLLQRERQWLWKNNAQHLEPIKKCSHKSFLTQGFKGEQPL